MKGAAIRVSSLGKVLIALSLLVAYSRSNAQQPQTYGQQAQPPKVLKGGAQVNVYGEDSECGGTDRRYYDEQYGTQAIVVTGNQQQAVYSATAGHGWHRCGDCSKRAPGYAICWPEKGYENVVDNTLNAGSASNGNGSGNNPNSSDIPSNSGSNGGGIFGGIFDNGPSGNNSPAIPGGTQRNNPCVPGTTYYPDKVPPGCNGASLSPPPPRENSTIGAYDPCNNPNAIDLPQCQARGSVNQKSQRSQSPSPVGKAPPPCIAPPSQDIRTRLLDGAAQLDRIATDIQSNELAATSEFFRGLTETVSNELKFLSQRPGDPAQQILDGAINYLNSDARKNDQQLRAAAIRSIELMRENPAYFFGTVTPDIVQIAECEAPALIRAVNPSKIARAERAEQRLVDINRASQAFADETNQLPANRTFGTEPGVPPGKPSIQNYFCGRTNCFPVMIAEVDTRLGRDLRGRPFVALDIPPGPGEVLPTPAARAEEVLRKRYGGRVMDPQWSVDRALNQIWGIPTEMDVPRIAAEIERGGQDALGGVFFEGVDGNGHVINVRNEGGVAYFYDQQNGLAQGELASMFAQSRRVWFYRVN